MTSFHWMHFWVEDKNLGKKKKKVDRVALASPMMRMPRLDIQVARDLIDIGVKELYELEGRAAESLFEEIKKLRPDTPDYQISTSFAWRYILLKTDSPDPQKLHPCEWGN